MTLHSEVKSINFWKVHLLCVNFNGFRNNAEPSASHSDKEALPPLTWLFTCISQWEFNKLRWILLLKFYAGVTIGHCSLKNIFLQRMVWFIFVLSIILLRRLCLHRLLRATYWGCFLCVNIWNVSWQRKWAASSPLTHTRMSAREEAGGVINSTVECYDCI